MCKNVKICYAPITNINVRSILSVLMILLFRIISRIAFFYPASIKLNYEGKKVRNFTLMKIKMDFLL